MDAQRGPRELQSAHILLSGSLMTSLRIFCALSFSACVIAEPLMLKSCPCTQWHAHTHTSSARRTCACELASAIAIPARARILACAQARVSACAPRRSGVARAQTYRRVDAELCHVVEWRRHATTWVVTLENSRTEYIFIFSCLLRQGRCCTENAWATVSRDIAEKRPPTT
jgi:hypothetical protein